mgnify:CR=1 FL=1
MVEIKNVSDLNEIEEIFINSCKNNSLGIGYPRCDNKGELKAEIELYNQEILESSFKILKDDIIVGALIFLKDEAENTTYIGGPVFKEGVAISNVLDFVFDKVVQISNPNSNLICCPLDENIQLVNYLTNTNWFLDGESLEMKYSMIDDSRTLEQNDNICKRLEKETERATFDAVADLLGTTHNWNSNHQERVLELLADGFEINYISQAELIVSAIVWIDMKNTDFSRIDYVSTNVNSRRKGYAKKMVNTVILKNIKLKNNHIYLATSPNNTVAISFYKKMGFSKNLISLVYTKKMRT